jgi:hypothetical protein
VENFLSEVARILSIRLVVGTIPEDSLVAGAGSVAKFSGSGVGYYYLDLAGLLFVLFVFGAVRSVWIRLQSRR